MSNRLSGHTLRYEGAPFSADGTLIYDGMHVGTSGEGRAKCSCGALSPVLSSGAQRKAWHRQHKAAIAAGRTA